MKDIVLNKQTEARRRSLEIKKYDETRHFKEIEVIKTMKPQDEELCDMLISYMLSSYQETPPPAT